MYSQKSKFIYMHMYNMYINNLFIISILETLLIN